MSQRTLLLILVLLVITGGLVWFALYSKQQPAPYQTTTIPTPTMVAHAESIITLSPATVNLSSSSGSVAVNISTGTNKATAVQLELSYDPTVITAADITQGSFFPNSVVLLKNVDKIKGRITFALGITPTAAPVTGTGTVATVTFTLAPSATQTAITVLPTTLVTAQGETGSVLKQSTGATITKTSVTSSPLQPSIQPSVSQ